MIRTFLLTIVVLYSCFTTVPSGAAPVQADELIDQIHWFGQAAVRIDAPNAIVCIDPYNISTPFKADVILITHKHEDHYSPEDIAKVKSDDTVFAAPEDVAADLKKNHQNKVVEVAPGSSITVKSIPIKAVPAYNAVKTKFHPRKNNWVGYIITVGGVDVYHSGDTERIPEMKTFKCDIALLPLGQTYTMNSVEEAADAARDVQAKYVIPIHYGLYEGTKEDAVKFHKLLKDEINVILKRRE